MPLRVRHESVELWPTDSRPGNPQVHTFPGALPPAALGEFLKLPCLQGDILTVIARTNSRVQRDSDGSCVSHLCTLMRQSVCVSAIFF